MRLDKFDKAVELMQRGGIERCELRRGRLEYYVRSHSDPAKEYTVSDCEVYASCDCQARGVCSHMLASVGRDVATFVWLARRVESSDELEQVVSAHRERIAKLPEQLKTIAREELRVSRRRLEDSPVAA